MQKSLQDMNVPEQQALVKEISKVLQAHDLSEIEVTVTTEQICKFESNVEVKQSKEIYLKGYVASHKNQNVEKFHEAI